MAFIFVFRLVLWIAELVLGVGLVFNCFKGLASREGMYDRDSTKYMTWGQVGGIVLGIWMVAEFFGLVAGPVALIMFIITFGGAGLRPWTMW